MSYCILIRMPSGALVPVTGDDETILEFESEDLAMDTATDMPICRAFNFQVMEVDL